jgi:hypothetical protein
VLEVLVTVVVLVPLFVAVMLVHWLLPEGGNPPGHRQAPDVAVPVLFKVNGDWHCVQT